MGRLAGTALSLLALTLVSVGCASTRAPIPVGEIPPQVGVPAEDEEYGQEVFRELSKTYTLDNDDKRIAHIRAIVERLTQAAQVDRNPWHVYIFDDPNFANAAATRGNFIFVWTGIFRDLRTDAELAAILSHELAHVLAGHTAPNPYEETARIISGVMGDVAGQVVSYQGPYAVLADLAALLVREMVAAAFINPGSQENELEADQVGLFIMADAGYDPSAALEFWDRVKDLPGYRGGTISALSSHPSSESRLDVMRELLPLAMERFKSSQSGPKSSPASLRHDKPSDPLPAPAPSSRSESAPSKPALPAGSESEWVWKPSESGADTGSSAQTPP